MLQIGIIITDKFFTKVFMKQVEFRQSALRVLRSQLRTLGYEPKTVTSETAELVLDDLSRLEPNLPVSKWYLTAKDNQVKLLLKEFKEWQHGHY